MLTQDAPSKGETLSSDICNKVNKNFGADEIPGLARNTKPVKTVLSEGSKIKRKTVEKFSSIEFLQYSLIRPCHSPHHTPRLPVKKPYSEEYHFVQDLRAINNSGGYASKCAKSIYTLLL